MTLCQILLILDIILAYDVTTKMIGGTTLVIAVPVERFLYAGSWLIRISKSLGIYVRFDIWLS